MYIGLYCGHATPAKIFPPSDPSDEAILEYPLEANQYFFLLCILITP